MTDMSVTKFSETNLFGRAVFRTLAAFSLALTVPFAASAEVDEAELDQLMDAMLFDEVVSVLSQEGQGMAEDFADAGYGVPKPAWSGMLTRLYDPDVMTQAFHDEMAASLDGCDLKAMVAFFSTDLGERIARLELDTRRAMSDDAAQAAAGQAWAELDPDTKRAQLIEDYVQVNDLVEMNVVGAMNSDIAYYQGLWNEGFEMEDGLTDRDLLNQIWASEPDVRADVSEWVYGFSTLAYETLSDEEFKAYVDFARTKAGQELNSALFASFDAVYEQLSRGLGAGTATLMQQYEGEQL
ncbi:DUF2059 domain-containing protein [Celeribacter sp. ULVN23_4]